MISHFLFLLGQPAKIRLATGLGLALGVAAVFLSLMRSGVAAPIEETRTGLATVAATSGRPLSAALELIGYQLNCLVTYEDPPYQNASAIQSLTPDGPQVPAQGNLLFAYDTNQSPSQIIQTLVEKYNAASDQAKFQLLVTQDQGKPAFNVVPVSFKNKSGAVEKWQSPLETNISIEMTGTYFAVAARIAQLVSNSQPSQIQAAESPFRGAFYTEKVTLVAHNKTARSCLNSLLTQFNLKRPNSESALCWGIFRDPVYPVAFLWFDRSHIRVPDGAETRASDASANGTTAFYVESARPLADAVRLIGQQVGQTMIVEDTPYLCSCSVMKDKNGLPYQPRGGILEFSYPTGNKPLSKVEAAIADFSARAVGQYKIQEQGKALYVYPTKFLSEQEQERLHEPLLLTSVEIPAGSSSLSEWTRQIAHALSKQSRYPVAPGQLPADADEKMLYMGGTRPAFEHLVGLSKRLNKSLFWQLLYDPRRAAYVLQAQESGQIFNGNGEAKNGIGAVNTNIALPHAEDDPKNQIAVAVPTVKVGDVAPDFTAIDANSKTWKLSELKGKNVLLTFFPKCFTGGCANHLSSLRDHQKEFDAADTQILAVSVDAAEGEKGQRAFAKQWGFTFPLIPDTSRQLGKQFGAIQNDDELAARMSVLVDKTGIVRWIDTDVHVQTHGVDALDKIRKLGLNKIN